MLKLFTSILETNSLSSHSPNIKDNMEYFSPFHLSLPVSVCDIYCKEIFKCYLWGTTKLNITNSNITKKVGKSCLKGAY